MNASLRKPMSQDEFFRWAEAQEGRYEFDGTAPVAMTGGTNRHGMIVAGQIRELGNALRGRSCRVMPAEGGGVATVGRTVRYPDAAITCSPIAGDARLIPEPVAVFEVLSGSSDERDRVVKLGEYHAVPTIRRYGIIEQSGIGLVLYSRDAGEPWRAVALAESDTLTLPDIGVMVAVRDLYDGVRFDQVDAENSQL